MWLKAAKAPTVASSIWTPWSHDDAASYSPLLSLFRLSTVRAPERVKAQIHSSSRLRSPCFEQRSVYSSSCYSCVCLWLGCGDEIWWERISPPPHNLRTCCYRKKRKWRAFAEITSPCVAGWLNTWLKLFLAKFFLWNTWCGPASPRYCLQRPPGNLSLRPLL